MILFKKIRKKLCVCTTRIRYSIYFGKIGANSYIEKPVQIDNPRGICLGDYVAIGKASWLYLDDCTARLEIGDHTSIGHFFHVATKRRVEIQRSVLIADKVFISDSSHRYEDIMVPVKDQGLVDLNEVHIGEGSWIGENVCIIGASIGKHCVIGANSVVLNSIPDYSVAVGCPAKIVKRYDQISDLWVKSNE